MLGVEVEEFPKCIKHESGAYTPVYTIAHGAGVSMNMKAEAQSALEKHSVV